MFKESKIIFDNIKFVNKYKFWFLKYDSLIMKLFFRKFFPNIKRIKLLMKHLYIIYTMIVKKIKKLIIYLIYMIILEFENYLIFI